LNLAIASSVLPSLLSATPSANALVIASAGPWPWRVFLAAVAARAAGDVSLMSSVEHVEWTSVSFVMVSSPLVTVTL
jgi:hypothetical protein